VNGCYGFSLLGTVVLVRPPDHGIETDKPRLG
jgi:hypothetical protein